jgi:general stress protein 26
MHLLERNGSLLWFATSVASEKVDQIARQPLVTVVFARPDLFNYATILGRAEVLKGTEEERRAMWHEEWADHWPLGIDDPDYALLCVTGEHGSCYLGYMDSHEEIDLRSQR